MANRKNDNEEQSNHPACAACKNQRKKCPSSCILRPHFPASKSDEFLAVHKIFGVANVTKMMREANSPADQDQIAKSLYWEAAMWVQDPIRGPYGFFTRLQDEIRALREYVNKQRLLLLQNRNAAPVNSNNFHGNMMMNYGGNSNNIRGPLWFSGPYRQLQGISMNEGDQFISNNGGNCFNEAIGQAELDVDGALTWHQQNYRSSKHEKIQ